MESLIETMWFVIVAVISIIFGTGLLVTGVAMILSLFNLTK